MVRWLERQGYDVTYCTSLDLHENPELLGYQNGLAGALRHKSYLSVGHDEYWSFNMRTNAEAARDRGVNLGFFAANSAYWKVRFEDTNRTMVCYKRDSRDPYDGEPLATVRWREEPAAYPEINLIGVQYLKYCESDLLIGTNIVIANPKPDHWLYVDTDLQAGAILPGLLGYEADGYMDSHLDPCLSLTKPPAPIILAHSPMSFRVSQDPEPPLDFTWHSDVTIYTASSGAQVFATGSMDWNYGLDFWADGTDYHINPSVQQMTHNVLRTFAGCCASSKRRRSLS
jgi:hypothetical protein